MKYDNGSLAVLRDVSDIHQYALQNARGDVCRKREIRMALRALDGQAVFWPYRYIKVSQMPSQRAATFRSPSARPMIQQLRRAWEA